MIKVSDEKLTDGKRAVGVCSTCFPTSRRIPTTWALSTSPTNTEDLGHDPGSTVKEDGGWAAAGRMAGSHGIEGTKKVN